MPVDKKAIKTAVVRLLTPALISYFAAIFILIIIFEETQNTIYLIYFSYLIIGSTLVAFNERGLFSKLMDYEMDAYFRSFDKKARKQGFNPNKRVEICIIQGKNEFIHIQYDYYIRKTTLTQKAGSPYLYSIMAGVLFDLYLNTTGDIDIMRTTILMVIVALIATLFLTIVILKYAEYNAGCAVYRNAILGVSLLTRKFDGKKHATFKEIYEEIGWVLQNLRCSPITEESKEKSEQDGLRTAILLEFLGYIQEVPKGKKEKERNCV